MRNKIVYLLLLVSCISIILQSCDNEEGLNYKRYYVNGKGLYEKNCQNCHGSDGTGLGTLYPPLTDNAFLLRNKKKLACIIRNGQNEQIVINQISYQGSMPGNETLAEIDIAQIIVYITNSFGNKQGFYSSEQTGMDLKECN